MLSTVPDTQQILSEYELLQLEVKNSQIWNFGKQVNRSSIFFFNSHQRIIFPLLIF